MTKKHLIAATLFAILTAILFAFSFLHQQRIAAGQVRGKLTFEHTQNNIRQLRRIQLTTPEYGEINIYYQDGDWHFAEAKDYFVNVHRLADFYNMVNNSLIETVSPANKSELQAKELTPETATKIVTYDNSNNLLDEIYIGKTSDTASHYAYNPHNPHYYYVISDVGSFSGAAPDWVPYPLLIIDHRNISSIKIQNKTLGRETINQLMRTSLSMRHIADVLSLINYDGVGLKADLDNDSTIKTKPRHLEITMADGLIYEMVIYNIADTYWLGINLKSAHLAQKKVSSFIADNQKYFSGWLFLLNSQQGKTLYEM